MKLCQGKVGANPQRGRRLYRGGGCLLKILIARSHNGWRRVLVRRLPSFSATHRLSSLYSSPTTAAMREVISIHIGQAGIQVSGGGKALEHAACLGRCLWPVFVCIRCSQPHMRGSWPLVECVSRIAL